MKTVRFSEVVKRGGEPEPYLVLMKPAQDKTLQGIIKQHRVMTVFQPTVGTKTDYGEVGFEEGGARQYLVFPKSIRAFEGRKVVGIKYELLSSADVPKSKRARAPKPPKKARPKETAPVKEEETPSKVIDFPAASPRKAEPKAEPKAAPKADLREVKRLAKQAMQALEKGKQIVAFNLLKRIAEA